MSFPAFPITFDFFFVFLCYTKWKKRVGRLRKKVTVRSALGISGSDAIGQESGCTTKETREVWCNVVPYNHVKANQRATIGMYKKYSIPAHLLPSRSRSYPDGTTSGNLTLKTLGKKR